MFSNAPVSEHLCHSLPGCTWQELLYKELPWNSIQIYSKRYCKMTVNSLPNVK